MVQHHVGEWPPPLRTTLHSPRQAASAWRERHALEAAAQVDQQLVGSTLSCLPAGGGCHIRQQVQQRLAVVVDLIVYVGQGAVQAAAFTQANHLCVHKHTYTHRVGQQQESDKD